MMREIKAVIFDMDGLAFDTERMGYKAYLRAAQKFGFQVNLRVHDALAGQNERQIRAELRRIYGIGEEDVVAWRTYIAEQKAAILAEQGGRPHKKAGLLELLCYLDERSIPYALASSSKREVIRAYVEAEYLTHSFTHVVDGTMVRLSKPDPEIFLLASDLLGVEPAQTLVLEDSKAGICAANRGGYISGFVYDNLEDLPEVDEGMPLLVDLPAPSPEATGSKVRHSFAVLDDAISLIEASRMSAAEL